MKLNVRCCCDGTRILGTLQVEEGARYTQTVRIFIEPRTIDVWTVSKKEPEAVPCEPSTDTATLKTLSGPGHHRELAVYSDDRPIEFWRRVAGFVEGERV